MRRAGYRGSPGPGKGRGARPPRHAGRIPRLAGNANLAVYILIRVAVQLEADMFS
ncbi:MAG: hypothetical protein OXG35_21795 [Acidobacteria bacterium]|nr:hypothetical protein [Acidobacteriota bacterium]